MTTKKACLRYQNLPNAEKEKKLQCGCECYKNLSEDEKINCLNIEINIIKWEKNAFL